MQSCKITSFLSNNFPDNSITNLSAMKTFHLALLLLYFMLLASTAISRPLQKMSYNSELVSDGVDKGLFKKENGTSFNIRMNGDQVIMDSEREGWSCVQMYGFLPCSETISGHLFLIIVYEYLLFHGESYVASGGKRIFKILGPGVFGACIFQIIGSLPEALILLASGLLDTREVAQECVLTGVGLLAGSTILLLTLVWGTCVFLGSQDFPNQLRWQSNISSFSDYTEQNPLERLFLSLWPGYGVVTDLWTGYTARIMLCSLVPFIIIQFPRLFHVSPFGDRVFVLSTLIVSVIFLFSYFFYQLFQPWIQKRQLLYLKHEFLVVDILKHLQSHTMGNLFNDVGEPNLSVIRRLFEETDRNGDKFITKFELKEFLQEINFRKFYSDKDKATEDMMKDFDVDNDQRISIEEFVKGMEKWIKETVKDSSKTLHINEVVQTWIEKKREEHEIMKQVIPKILEHIQAFTCESLLTEDGTPDVPAIKRLFKDVDHDKDDSISYSELKELIMNVKFGIIPHDVDNATSKMMKELDINGDQLISEDEFVIGLSNWLDTTCNQTPILEKGKDFNNQKSWEQMDKLVEDKFLDKSLLAWTKALFLVLIGILMLGIVAEPLIHSVQNLSKAANIPSFFIAFILVPFATNARIAISTITEAHRKKPNIISLTLSEIYNTALMNNILGFSVLLSLIYFRGFPWNFSFEILMVLVVSSVVGFLASFSTVIPVWTSALAYLMYPLSLLLLFVHGDFN